MNRIVIPGQQRTEAWFAARCGCITASNMHCVMAKPKAAKKDGTYSDAPSAEATTRMNYRVRLAIEQITGIPDKEDTISTPAMRRGEEREAAAAMHYEIVTGNEVEHVQFVKFDGHPIGASPDGLVGKRGGIETKCGNQATHLSYLQRTTVPPEYEWQVHGVIWVCELDWVDFVSYHPDFPEALRLAIIRVRRDEEKIRQLQEGCGIFIGDVARTRRLIENLMAQHKEAA